MVKNSMSGKTGLMQSLQIANIDSGSNTKKNKQNWVRLCCFLIKTGCPSKAPFFPSVLNHINLFMNDSSTSLTVNHTISLEKKGPVSAASFCFNSSCWHGSLCI